jgi:hypothetical protein
MDGAVLGVLNLDAGWNYAAMGLDPDPDVHFSDTRIQAVVNLMQSTAFGIAGALIEAFPTGGD